MSYEIRDIPSSVGCSQEIWFDEKSYNIDFNTDHTLTDQPCSICGKTERKNVSRSLESVYKEITETETTIPIDVSSSFGKTILEALNQHLKEIVYCDECFDDTHDDFYLS